MSGRVTATLGVIGLLALAGCVSVPRRDQAGDAGSSSGGVSVSGASAGTGSIETTAESRGERIARLARAQLGAPYRFGGADPQGFDCSGLVRYVFQESGVDLPRTAAAQWQASQPISLAYVVPGDLIFYASDGSRNNSGGGVDHVGIYVGDGMMVHAPRTGKLVELRRLDDRWYAQRFRAAGHVAP